MAIVFGMATFGDEFVAADLAARAAKAPVRAAAIVQHHGLLMTTQVKANASGRPGPRAQTGDYRRRINLEFRARGAEFTAITGTNAVQARRLEHGFVGVDSLGRHYNQPPYPHFAPARAKIEPMFVAAMRTIVL